MRSVQDSQRCTPKVFSSPTSRTIDTAVELCVELGIHEIVPHYALNCCAAARYHGVERGAQVAPRLDERKGVSLSCWPPEGDVALIDQRNRQQGGFVQAIEELAACSDAPKVLVAVTHREGIWELQQEVQTKPGCLYCCVFVFLVDTNVTERPVRLQATFDGFEKRKDGDTFQILGDSEYEKVLKEGKGQVLFHRMERRQPGVTTKLWVTPGVDGLWVPGDGVPCGEIVELMSVPVQGEGDDQSRFVRVRRANGQEGWTKIKNIHLKEEKDRVQTALMCRFVQKPVSDLTPERHAELLRISSTVTEKLLARAIDDLRGGAGRRAPPTGDGRKEERLSEMLEKTRTELIIAYVEMMHREGCCHLSQSQSQSPGRCEGESTKRNR